MIAMYNYLPKTKSRHKILPLKKLYGLFFSMMALLFSFAGFAQQRTVSGKITFEADNQPLAGVSVTVKGTNVGTSTDASGNFSITASTGSTLVFSSVGYTPQEVVVGDNTIVAVSKVTPQGENTYVNDIVVARSYQKHGYGSMVIHAALRFGSSQHEASVNLDGFEGSPVNAWYQETWGLVPGELCEESFAVGDHTLPQRRFSSPDHLTVRGIVAALEKKTPGLASGRIFPSSP